MDNRLALTCGTDIPIPSCKLILHQPTIEEISYVGNTNFFIGVQTLCLHKSMFVEDKNVLEDITSFQIFMMIMNDKETLEKKNCTLQVLYLLFPNYRIILTPMSILFQLEKNQFIVDSSNFEDLQSYIRQVFCANTGPMNQQAFNPGNDRAKEIAQKLMRGRQRVAEQKKEKDVCIFSQYISILSVGLQKDKNILKKYTMYQLYDEFERYILKINWDVDLQARLAGAKPDGKVENWTKVL